MFIKASMKGSVYGKVNVMKQTIRFVQFYYKQKYNTSSHKNHTINLDY